MAISNSSDPSLTMSRSEWLSTLPLWRRCLAMLNWRPVYDIEQRTKLLEIENKRLAEIESRLDALLRSPDSCLPIPPEIDSDSSGQSQR
ncbi:MAG: hypothetical protein EB136_10830 [Synechococcaceae bacterium WBB_3_034]|jgi:hypothetical protein|nr:hypothetical protein [Synechococcaceae bacterium WBB_3_034]